MTIPNEEPLMTPPTVSALVPLVVIVGETVSVTAPAPRFSGLLPPNVKLPLQVSGTAELNVTARPLVLLIAPPEIVNGAELRSRS